MLSWVNFISTCSITKQYYILRFHYNPWVQLAVVTWEIFRFIQEFVVFLSKAWAGYLWWVSASYIKYIALMYIDISERFINTEGLSTLLEVSKVTFDVHQKWSVFMQLIFHHVDTA